MREIRSCLDSLTWSHPSIQPPLHPNHHPVAPPSTLWQGGAHSKQDMQQPGTPASAQQAPRCQLRLRAGLPQPKPQTLNPKPQVQLAC